MRVNVLGLGYVGLPTAVLLASNGCRVVGVDINANRVKSIKNGSLSGLETDVAELLTEVIHTGALTVQTKPEIADVFIICVPTPTHGGSKVPDMSSVQQAGASIAPFLAEGCLVIVESTCPVGATDRFIELLAELRPDLALPTGGASTSSVNVAYCPERVLPGNTLSELRSNPRIIGGATNSCSQKAVDFYNKHVSKHCSIASSTKLAEFTKLIENSFRDLNIAFANELSMICEGYGLNPWEAISLANQHPRVNILRPGPGVGGHCIAVDPWFLISGAGDLARIIRAAREVNDSKPKWVLNKLFRSLGAASTSHSKKKPLVALYGITYKPDIDDLRESPSLAIAAEIVKSNLVTLLIVEPHLRQLPAGLSGAKLVEFELASKTAEFHLVLVNHSEFRHHLRPKGHVIDVAGVWQD